MSHPHSQSHSHSLLEINPSRETENGKIGNGESGSHEQQEEEETGKRQAVKRKKLADGHGYPESANTWEPIGNLHMCRDIVEAFEESLSSGKKKSSRRRKRIFTQEKRKMQNSYGVSKTKRVPVKMTLGNEAHDSATLNDNSSLQAGTVEDTVEHSEGIKRSKAPTRVDCSDTETVALHVDSNAKKHVPQLSAQNANGRTSDEHFQQLNPVGGDNSANCQSKVNGVEGGLCNQFKGAKRRKSGSVRRVTLEATALDVGDSGNTILQSSCDRAEQLGKPDNHCKRKIDSPRSSAVITRLIKPISYSTSVTNNIQDVSVTFVAMRSDGKEVMVDNKFLRANNPHLLIDFYEQHLRYNPY
ncbi:hypothetical protein Cgig2_026480 [Carnegiea gigantea]|uniref:Chromo shadow domain-containing protein n=1 Tax=Carnegiea gigantea TaxID=171969 RepID=A0A9Q1KFR2_9CARY|nr:hypothetical protein Cgig2_026480 [Carnegiea gigantea]